MRRYRKISNSLSHVVSRPYFSIFYLGVHFPHYKFQPRALFRRKFRQENEQVFRVQFLVATFLPLLKDATYARTSFLSISIGRSNREAEDLFVLTLHLDRFYPNCEIVRCSTSMKWSDSAFEFKREQGGRKYRTKASTRQFYKRLREY